MISPHHLWFLISLRGGQNSVITDGQFSVVILTLRVSSALGIRPGEQKSLDRGSKRLEAATTQTILRDRNRNHMLDILH
jgi:hypothetical protein